MLLVQQQHLVQSLLQLAIRPVDGREGPLESCTVRSSRIQPRPVQAGLPLADYYRLVSCKQEGALTGWERGAPPVDEDGGQTRGVLINQVDVDDESKGRVCDLPEDRSCDLNVPQLGFGDACWSVSVIEVAHIHSRRSRPLISWTSSQALGPDLTGCGWAGQRSFGTVALPQRGRRSRSVRRDRRLDPE